MANFVRTVHKMESGADRYEIVTHKGKDCDCGVTRHSYPMQKKNGKWSHTDWNVTFIHKSRV